MASADESSIRRRIRKKLRKMDRKSLSKLKRFADHLYKVQLKKRLKSRRKKKKSSSNNIIDQHYGYEPPCFLMSTLSQDLLLEIFLRLANRRSVIRCSTVCKRWYSLISPPQFILNFNQFRYHRNQLLACSLLPFLITTSNTASGKLFSIKSSNNNKPKISATSSCNLNFLPYWPDHHVVIRASFQDLLLVSCGYNNYYICNPFTKQWLALPPKEPHWYYGHEFSGFGLVCKPNKNNIDDQYRYRVVIIHYCRFKKYQKTYEFGASVFCSKAAKWLDSYSYFWHTLSEGYEHIDPNYNGAIDVVTSNGLLYWLGGLRKFKGIIACDPFSVRAKKEEMKGYFIDLPVGFRREWRSPSKGKVCLGVVRGQIRLLQLVKVNQACFGLKVWELIDYGHDIAPSTKSWLLVHEVKLKGVSTIFVAAFHPNDGNAIFVVRDRNIYLYMIGEERYENIGEFPYEDFPYEEYENYIKKKVAGYLNVFTVVQPSLPTPIFDALPSI